MSFPNFSNIQSFVQNTLSERKGNTELVSKLNPFVRITSGAGGGLVMVSNPDFKLLQAAGTTYGSANQAGAVGTTLGGAPVNPNSGTEVLKSFPIDFENSKNSSLTITQTVCIPKSELSVSQHPFLKKPVNGLLLQVINFSPKMFLFIMSLLFQSYSVNYKFKFLIFFISN